MQHKRVLSAVSILALLVIQPAFSQDNTLKNNDKNKVAPTQALAGKQDPITCTLSLPERAVNGERFIVGVSYEPAISGIWKEQFIFPWPSVAPSFDDFNEETVRVKKYNDPEGASGSFEYVVTPGAGYVQGPMTAVVVVTNERGAVCTATADMVILPAEQQPATR